MGSRYTQHAVDHVGHMLVHPWDTGIHSMLQTMLDTCWYSLGIQVYTACCRPCWTRAGTPLGSRYTQRAADHVGHVLVHPWDTQTMLDTCWYTLGTRRPCWTRAGTPLGHADHVNVGHVLVHPWDTQTMLDTCWYTLGTRRPCWTRAGTPLGSTILACRPWDTIENKLNCNISATYISSAFTPFPNVVCALQLFWLAEKHISNIENGGRGSGDE